MNVFDLNNPIKPTPIPTKPGRWHKADTAFEDKPNRVASTAQPISRVQSAAAIRKFGLFDPGMEKQNQLFSSLIIFLFVVDASNKNAKYYFKVAFSWICGVEHQADYDGNEAIAPTMPPLAKENLFWKRISNVNGVLIVAFCAFLWAFFTDYRIDKMRKLDWI